MTEKLYSYAEIMNLCIGPWGLKLYSFFAFIFYFSILVNYIFSMDLYMGSLIPSVKEGFPAVLYFMISASIEIVLCVLTSNMSKVHILSFIAVAAFIIILICGIIKAIIFMSSTEADLGSKFSVKKNFELSGSAWKITCLLLKGFIDFVYGYSYHSPFPIMIGNLQDKSEEATKKTHKMSFGLICGAYFLISIFGYLTETDLPIILFDDINAKMNALTVFIKIDLIIFLLTLLPLRYMIIRDGFTSLVGFKDLPYLFESLAAAFWLIIANVASYFGENYNDLFGGFFGICICFVFPVIIYSVRMGLSKLTSIFGYIMAGFFLVIGLITCVNSFNNEN